jgi:hypothetical protein
MYSIYLSLGYARDIMVATLYNFLSSLPLQSPKNVGVFRDIIVESTPTAPLLASEPSGFS